MEGTGGKRNNSCLNISNLPDNVIEYILERLPIQDAVKTSALARSWRYKWTTISNLTFDYGFARYLQAKSLSESDFASIITNILIVHHGSTIHTFDLYVPDDYVGVDLWWEIHFWMYFLSWKDVKQFHLKYGECSPDEFYPLPSLFYTYLNLTYLEVCYCVFTPPSGFRGFPKLTSLMLLEVTVEKKSLERLISNCPLLWRLDIHVCFGTDHLNISSTSLRDLYMGSELKCGLEWINVDAENLEKVWLDGRLWMHLENTNPDKKGKNNLIEELDRLPKLEDLHIGYNTFEFITAAGAPRKLPTPLIHLKKVEIEKVNFANCAQANSAVCLIRSAPNLQDLVISADNEATNDVEQVSSFPKEDWGLNCLHTVNLSFFRGSRPELEFIKSLLASLPSLNLMNIDLDSSVDAEVKSWLSEELLKAYRASLKVEVKL